MPIRIAVENREELRLIVYHFSGHIDVAEVFESVARAGRQIAPGQPYRELLIFEHDTDLSDFHPTALQDFFQRCVELYGQLKLGPRTAAAVLDASLDAKLIMPLFNALSLAGAGADLSFELFTETGPALEKLGIPLDQGLAIIGRTV